MIIFYISYKYLMLKKKKHKDVRGAEQEIHRAFTALAQEIKHQVAKLDGSEWLSDRERIIYERLKKALEIAEKMIGKEVKDIEKQTK